MSSQDEHVAQGKGRPTRSRREATAGRKQGLSAPRDAAAARARDREARRTARAGLLAGDPRYFPRRDQGPVREFVRDFIDSRRTAGEYFVMGALLVMVLGLVPNKAVQSAVVIGWSLALSLVVADTVFVAWRLSSAVRARFDSSSRRGAVSYGLLRALQMRRFRIPPPRVRPGGAPVGPRSSQK